MIMPVLAVKDLDASTKFYTEKLGFKLDFNLAGPNGKAMFAGVSFGEGNSFLLSAVESMEHRGGGVVFMVYLPNSKDLDAYYGAVQTKGIAIAQPIKNEYWGDRVFSISDPDGYYLSFCKTVKQLEIAEIEKLAAQE
jgi:PhnB protein